jgi:hypothetical protein
MYKLQNIQKVEQVTWEIVIIRNYVEQKVNKISKILMG